MFMVAPDPDAGLNISDTSPTGVLHPGRLEGYRAQRHEPDVAIASVVEWFWTVRWSLASGEELEQRIVPAPVVHLTIESGDVPAPLVVTGPYRRVWTRILRGSGAAFGIRLRPGGLAIVSDRLIADVVDTTVAITPDWDPRLHVLLGEVAAAGGTDARIAAATERIAAALGTRTVSRHGRLAAAVLADLGSAADPPAVRDLAARNGVSERTIQRALRETTGFGPKWAARVLRLQRVIAALSTRPGDPTAELAHRLGFADQAHLIGEFRAVVGMTPGEYVQSLSTPATRPSSRED